MAYLIIALGIGLGLILLGKPVMKTMGKKVIKLDLVKAISAQFSVALISSLASIFGIPLSSSHSILGALIGLNFAHKIGPGREVYANET